MGLFLRSKRILQKNLFSTEAYKKKYLFYFIVVYPFLKSSTKEIYSKLDKFDSIKNKNYVLNYSRLELVKMLKMEKNSLENVVISKFPIIRKILLNLRFTKNCQFSRITGSGSACFGLYLNKRDASLALKQIKKKFPDFWCVISKTI